MKRLRGFTLAEVLITLAIIGVVAAISIPSVISNSQQQEFKTGLRKAVSVLNSAITMNMAIDGESPYDNANLMGYMMKHMSVMSSTDDYLGNYASGGWANIQQMALDLNLDGAALKLTELLCMKIIQYFHAPPISLKMPIMELRVYNLAMAAVLMD